MHASTSLVAIAGRSQQGAAQHLFHSVPQPDRGGGVLPWQQHRHVPGKCSRELKRTDCHPHSSGCSRGLFDGNKNPRQSPKICRYVMSWKKLVQDRLFWLRAETSKGKSRDVCGRKLQVSLFLSTRFCSYNRITDLFAFKQMMGQISYNNKSRKQREIFRL